MTSIILETSARAVFHTVVVFSLYLLFAGHNAPGGGFIGGLVAAAAVVLRFVAQGPDEVNRTALVSPETVLGLGALLAAGAGVVPWFTGGGFLQAGSVSLALGVLGTVKVTTVLVFDVGVYLIVLGLVLTVLRTLGGELDT